MSRTSVTRRAAGGGGAATNVVPPPRSLEEKFELLEARFTQPMVGTSSTSAQPLPPLPSSSSPTSTSLSMSSSLLQHQPLEPHSNLSEHSFFGFAASNLSDGTTATAATSAASNRRSLQVRSKRRTPPTLTSLEVVSRAAALHIQKVAANATAAPSNHSHSQSSHGGVINFGHSNSVPHSSGAGSSSSSNGSSNSSQHTLVTGNHQSRSMQQMQLQHQQRVVAESPPVLISPHHNGLPAGVGTGGTDPPNTTSPKPKVARTLLTPSQTDAASIGTGTGGTPPSAIATSSSGTKRKSIPKRKVSTVQDNLGGVSSSSKTSPTSGGRILTSSSPEPSSSSKRVRKNSNNDVSEPVAAVLASAASRSPRGNSNIGSNLGDHSRSNQGGTGTSSRQSTNGTNNNSRRGGTQPAAPPAKNKLIHDFFSAATHKRGHKERPVVGGAHDVGPGGVVATSATDVAIGTSDDAPFHYVGVPPASGGLFPSTTNRHTGTTTTLASAPPLSTISSCHGNGGTDWQVQCTKLQQQLQDTEEQLKAVTNNKTILHTALQAALEKTKRELAAVHEASARHTTQMAAVVEELVRWKSAKQAKDLRAILAADGARLGRIVYARAGMRALESWEEGHATKDLQQRREELKRKKLALTERQEDEERRRTDALTPSVEGDTPSATTTRMSPLEAQEARESLHMHMETLRREEQELSDEEQALNDEKAAHIRALKRVASEDASRFRARPKLHDRYVLDQLLGKGGFSEVWRAYDLKEMREVAVKIHQLDPRWPESKKENYTKHVSREYEIHRNVRHPRIVSLFDVFEIDNNSFATVLEVCKGIDLDTMLKSKKHLPERQARAILLQILSGMQYLSQPSGSRQGIIHYDLKPGNILFDEYGDAKITDFGLSKIVDAPDPAESMELTSQGAGTYWYLPPECFITGEQVRISNKVDVWSIGVIYYQMLYGRRPFGEGKSQDKLLSEHTMLNAHEVHLPDQPAVSDSGKEFLRQCLTYDQAFRPTIAQLCENSYVLQQGQF